MSPPLLGDDLLAPADALQLDLICDRFEKACKTGQRPSVEYFLAEASGLDHATLFRELLLLELTYRSLNGEAPSPEEYRQRFPDWNGLVEVVFAEFGTRATPIDVSGAPPTMAYSLARTATPYITTQARTVTTIGKYRVVERLGVGGQGEVFRAVHPNLPGRDVVIKWARQGLPADKQQLLLAEGRLLAQLDDPGLVRVYDVDVHDGRPYIVFEYVAGRSLFDQMQQERPSLREAATLVAQLAHTLTHVHQKGVLHRDLKPHNVLIDTAGRPRLLDFGLAWLQPPFGADADQLDRSISGTPQYMAPEQARGQTQRIGPASDVFGLGAVLYEMLTGQPPYQDANRLALWEKARQGNVTPPRQLNRRIPRALEAVCMKALAADPARRYPSARHLERALRRYLRRTQWALLAAAVLLVVAGGALLVGIGGKPGAWNRVIVERLNPWADTPLSGELVLRVWSQDHGKLGIRIDHPGALPVRSGEMVHLEVQLNQPAYSYLLLLDSQGQVQPLYPWKPELGFSAPPPAVAPVQALHSPPRTDHGWELDDNSGLETVLLLVRRTPLPADYDMVKQVGQLPVVPLRHPQEFAVRGLSRGDTVIHFEQDINRGFQWKAQEIDEPLLKVIQRLQPDFELIRAVRFAHVGR